MVMFGFQAVGETMKKTGGRIVTVKVKVVLTAKADLIQM
ncbi:Uncharacterised protein [Mycobacteroides abscessus subsp. abscessus]|nr:Uncharacterised protein [Mycobacteroides abscessus subsp. abscessus]